MKPFFEHQLGADLLRLDNSSKVDSNRIYNSDVADSDHFIDRQAGAKIAYVVNYLVSYVDILTNASRFSDPRFWITSAEDKLGNILQASATLRQTSSTWNDTRLMLAEIRIDQLNRIIIELKRLEKHIDSVKV